MPVATILFRDGRSYRRDLFIEGLGRVGFGIEIRPKGQPQPGDALILWNRSRSFEPLAERYERAGGIVIVVENGYLPRRPIAAEKAFAISIGKHNGAGRWPNHDAPRFPIEMQPWRQDGDHILILPQRGIGSPGVAMPINWLRMTQKRIAAMTRRPVQIRKHPGVRPVVALEDDLARAWAVVTWGSGAAIKALVAGVPAFYSMNNWIGGPAALPLRDDIEHPYLRDRDHLARALSWAQWGESEVRSGEAFAALLECAA